MGAADQDRWQSVKTDLPPVPSSPGRDFMLECWTLYYSRRLFGTFGLRPSPPEYLSAIRDRISSRQHKAAQDVDAKLWHLIHALLDRVGPGDECDDMVFALRRAIQREREISSLSETVNEAELAYLRPQVYGGSFGTVLEG